MCVGVCVCVCVGFALFPPPPLPLNCHRLYPKESKCTCLRGGSRVDFVGEKKWARSHDLRWGFRGGGTTHTHPRKRKIEDGRILSFYDESGCETTHTHTKHIEDGRIVSFFLQ